MINYFHPLITIAIPTYNRADGYLRQAITCAVKQTYPNIEIIIADNCSTDNTETVVKNFNDSRIRYFRHETNIGPIKNTNFCLDVASGNYFLLLHDDDSIDDDFVESCMKAANHSTDIGLIRTGVRRIDSQGKILGGRLNMAGGLSTEEFFVAFLSRKVSMLLCSMLFNTKRLKEVGGFHSIYLHWDDVYAGMQMAARFGRVDVKDIKASFRRHTSQTTFNVNIREWVEDAIFLLNAMCDLVPQKKSLIRNLGMQYFARHSYEIASNIRSPLRRFLANLIVFKEFKYRHLPPAIHTIFSHTPLPYILKSIGR
ncbi:MAG: glycosyltransferase family 2 protein [Candidatus Scalindua sp.]|nr:glycosyltransferase family 2 protein [Candidatus Scalindua sp.]